MAKYTQEDYLSKLLPQSLAQMIVYDDLTANQYFDLLHQLWINSKEFLVEQKSEKEFIFSVTTQIDYICNIEQYHEEIEEINKNAATKEGQLDDWGYHRNIGIYNNTYITRLYCYIRNSKTLTVKELFSIILAFRRTENSIFIVNTVCQNFGFKITQNGKPVDLKKVKFDSIIEISRNK